MSIPPKSPPDWKSIQNAVGQVSWITEKQRPYFLHWVRDFLLSPAAQAPEPNNALADFLDNLRGKPNLQDWQLKQAERAVRWYQHKFRSPANLENSKEGQYSQLSGGSWEEVITTTRTILRQRDYAYRTEQTYVDWMSRFQRFIHPTLPGDLTCADVSR